MKIALAHKRYDSTGGTERALCRSAEGLRDRGHAVHLFCGQFRTAPPEGVSCHTVPYWPLGRTIRLLSFAFLAPRLIARHNCDVVMSFDHMVRQDVYRSGGGPHQLFLEKMARTGKAWRSLWYRASPYHSAIVAIEKRQVSAPGSQRIIAVCRQVKEEIIAAHGVTEGKIAVIHNGVDHQRFHPRRRLPEGMQIRKSLEIPSDARVVLFVGTGFRRKGLDRLLHLWASEDLNNIYLLVVGGDARLSHYRRKWNKANILFVGAQAAVENYYAAANVFVLPSIQEAFGNVVLEALASGVPIITVPGVGATDELEEVMREGILSDPDDPNELKGKILKLSNSDDWPYLSREARQSAEKYTWDKYLDRIEDLLYETCKHRRNGPLAKGIIIE